MGNRIHDIDLEALDGKTVSEVRTHMIVNGSKIRGPVSDRK